MKKFLSNLMVLSLVFVLAKVAGPGGYSAFYGYGGTIVNTAESAMQFDSISDAYRVQIELGTDWDIVTQ